MDAVQQSTERGDQVEACIEGRDAFSCGDIGLAKWWESCSVKSNLSSIALVCDWCSFYIRR